MHARTTTTKKTVGHVDVVVGAAAVLTAGAAQIAGDEAQDAVIVGRGDIHLNFVRTLRWFAAQPCPK